MSCILKSQVPLVSLLIFPSSPYLAGAYFCQITGKLLIDQTMSTTKADAASEADSLNPHGYSCPNGSDFYVCYGSWVKFFGCCTIDPCGDRSGICPEANLRPANLSNPANDSIPSVPYCYLDSSSALATFYACAYDYEDSPSNYIGCCEINPCDTPAGCPRGQVKAVALFDNRSVASGPRSEWPHRNVSRVNLTFIDSNEQGKCAVSPSTMAGVSVGAIVAVLVLLGLFWKCRYVFLMTAKRIVH